MLHFLENLFCDYFQQKIDLPNSLVFLYLHLCPQQMCISTIIIFVRQRLPPLFMHQLFALKRTAHPI